MLVLENLNVRKERGQTVGRDQDLGIFGAAAPSYKISPEVVAQQRLLTQEDLNAAEISTNGDLVDGRQVIEYQKTLLSVLIRRKVLVSDKIAEIRATHKQAKRAEYQKLKAMYAKSKVKLWYRPYHESVKIPGVTRRKRDPERDTFRTVEVWGPWKKFPALNKHGDVIGYEWFRTTKKVKVRVKAWKWVVVKPPRVKRIRKKAVIPVQVRDWDKVIFEYNRFRILDFYKMEEELKPLLEQRKALVDRLKAIGNDHYCMRAYTTAFAAGMKSCQYDGAKHLKFKTATEEEINNGINRFLQQNVEDHLGYRQFVDPEDEARTIGCVADGYYFSGYSQHITPGLKKILGSAVIVGHTDPEGRAEAMQRVKRCDSFLDETASQQPVGNRVTYRPPILMKNGTTDPAEIELAETLAWSNVASLKGGSDYVFNIVRSIGELKDTKQTLRQGKDFLDFCKRIVSRGQIPDEALKSYLPVVSKLSIQDKSYVVSQPMIDMFRDQIKHGKLVPKASLMKLGAKQLVGLHLAWKFAVAPTIDDIKTVVAQSRKWLLDSRRLCSQMIETQRKSTVLHLRSKWKTSADRPHNLFMQVPAPKDAEAKVSKDSSVLISLPPPMFYHGKGASTSEAEAYQSYFSSKLTCENFTPKVHEEDCEVFWKSDEYGRDRPFLRTRLAEEEIEVRTSIRRRHIKAPATEMSGSMTREFLVVDGKDVAEALKSKLTMGSYATEEARGVVFGNYSVDDILDFLGDSSKGTLLNRLKRCVDTANLLVTAWELTPLSFIEDWFANTGDLARGLQNLLSMWMVDVPETEIWGTRKFELLTGAQTPLSADENLRPEVVDWYLWNISYYDAVTGVVSHEYFAAPKTIKIAVERSLTLSKTVLMGPSGLRRSFRGPVTADPSSPISDWSILGSRGWRPRCNINAGKLVTLAEMLTGMLL